MSEMLQIGGIHVSVIRTPKRRTIGLTIERDGTISARAPSNLSLNSLLSLLKKKELWMHASLARRNRSNIEGCEKSFVTGEGFFYLGRHYRLRVLASSNDLLSAAPLRLLRSRFLLSAKAVPAARDCFVKWYSSAGIRWLTKNLPRLQNRVGVSPKSVLVRDLGFRWGSCSPEGRLNFHWRTFMLPSRAIEYLVLHELCHLIVHNHSKDFWNEVGRVAPDFLIKEAWLNANAAHYQF
jgi:hypothetical protein